VLDGFLKIRIIYEKYISTKKNKGHRITEVLLAELSCVTYKNCESSDQCGNTVGFVHLENGTQERFTKFLKI